MIKNKIYNVYARLYLALLNNAELLLFSCESSRDASLYTMIDFELFRFKNLCRKHSDLSRFIFM